MDIDIELLERFEVGLNPQDIEASDIPADLVGYGEISAIFNINHDADVAYKRMPLFKSRVEAERYETLYHDYCQLLTEVGLSLPDSQTRVVSVPDRPVTLYIAQNMIDPALFCHKLIHSEDRESVQQMVEMVLGESKKIWRYCQENAPAMEIAVDGQLSNWAFEGEKRDRLVYIDTSTPFIRENGNHRLDPKLILQSAPKPLRGVFERLFAADVLNRYYDPRQNMMDLVANLNKEQKPDLIPLFIDIVNASLPDGTPPLDLKSVQAYYKQDKLIWNLFLGLRRVDRWVTLRLLRGRYEFILPGKIQR